MPSIDVRAELAALRSRLGGRAAGAWRLEGDRLVLIAFDPAPDLPPAVTLGFEAATREVDLTLVHLGIVRAATTGESFASIAADLPVDTGSGLWLRAFGAARSVAVPIVSRDGSIGAVVSVAMGHEPDEQAVSAMIRAVEWE
jgi:hypothetical protein